MKLDNRRGLLIPTADNGRGPAYHGHLKIDGRYFTVRAWKQSRRYGPPAIQFQFYPDTTSEPHDAARADNTTPGDPAKQETRQ